MHQRGRQGSPLVRARRPHSFRLDRLGLVSSQRVLDELTAASFVMCSAAREIFGELNRIVKWGGPGHKNTRAIKFVVPAYS
jgi:hypothetical protein